MTTRRPPTRPPHLYLDETWYIITGSTVKRVPVLRTNDHRRIWVNAAKQLTQEQGIGLRAWVLLPNHYHLLLRARSGRDIPKFIQRLHSGTARACNLQDHTPGRHIWYSYWDTCLRTAADYWTRFNYIHYNPVKHGYVPEAGAWACSSYHYYLRRRGSDWLADCWARYPVLEYLDGDDF